MGTIAGVWEASTSNHHHPVWALPLPGWAGQTVGAAEAAGPHGEEPGAGSNPGQA